VSRWASASKASSNVKVVRIRQLPKHQILHLIMLVLVPTHREIYSHNSRIVISILV
jgi:hypothetical protein